MSRWGLWMSAAALCAMSATACKKPTTGLRVMVTTDFVPSSTMPQLHSVRLRVTNLQTGAELAEETVNVVDGTVSLPLKFSVFLVGAPNERVRIEAEGHTVESQASGMFEGRPGPITAARMVTGFVEGQIRVVPLVLYRGCWDRRLACEPDTTCSVSAACESANRDANTLPTYDRDAGDPTDVFNIPMDASMPDSAVDSGVDAMPPPNDVMMPFDGMGPIEAGVCNAGMPPANPTIMQSSVTEPGTSNGLTNLDIATVSNGMITADPPVEIAWLESRSGMQEVLSARVSSSGTIARPAGASRVLAPGAQWIRVLRFVDGMRVFGLTLGSMGELGIASALIDESTGVGTSMGWNPMASDWGRGDVSSPLHANVGTFGGLTPNNLLSCYGTTTSTLRCFPNHLETVGGTPMSMAAFSVTLPEPVGRVLSVVEPAGAMGMQAAMELGDRSGLMFCSFSMMGGASPACQTVKFTAPERVVTGSASAVWPDGAGSCGPNLGWHVAVITTNAMSELTLRAGRIPQAGASASDLTIAVSGLPNRTSLDDRTSIAYSPATCEMLLAHAVGDSLNVRRARAADRMVSGVSTISIRGGSPVRFVPQAPPAMTGGGDMHLGAAVLANGSLSLLRVRASCGGPMM